MPEGGWVGLRVHVARVLVLRRLQNALGLSIVLARLRTGRGDDTAGDVTNL